MIGPPQDRVSAVTLLAVLLACSAGAVAAELPRACEELGGAQRELALEILSGEYPYDCCDDTIARCLEQEPVCSLAWRLAANICRRAALGQDAERIRHALARRARSMFPGGTPAEIDLEGAPAAGAGDAPVEVVVYACARCPFCSALVPQLHEAVVSGPLRNQAHLHLKVFPIRNHEFSKEGGLAFLAAVRQGRFWEYVLHAYAHFDGFRVTELAAWAEAVGMDREAFERDTADAAVREALVESKKEGLRNGVEATPTVFLDGRPYVGELTLEELVDVIAESCETKRGEVSGRP